MAEHEQHIAGEAHHHVVPIGMYVGVFAALLVLTVLTVAAATVDFGGQLNTIIALCIAVLKATLVVLIFMHVRWGGSILRIFVAAGFVWLMILLGMTMSDYASRDWVATDNTPGNVPRGLMLNTTEEAEHGANPTAVPAVPTNQPELTARPEQSPGARQSPEAQATPAGEASPATNTP